MDRSNFHETLLRSSIKKVVNQRGKKGMRKDNANGNRRDVSVDQRMGLDYSSQQLFLVSQYFAFRVVPPETQHESINLRIEFKRPQKSFDRMINSP